MCRDKKEKDDYPIIITAEEICEILHVSKPTAYEIMKASSFPLIKLGRCKRVFRDDFFDWLRKSSIWDYEE